MDAGSRAKPIVFFTAKKTLKANGRTITVEGHFRRMRTLAFRFDPDAPAGSPSFTCAQELDLEGLTTDAPTRDANLLAHLFRVTAATRWVALRVSPDGQSVTRAGDGAWLWEGRVHVALGKGLDLPCRVVFRHRALRHRDAWEARFAAPVTVAVSAFGLPFAEFLAKVGNPAIPDEVGLDWSTACFAAPRDPKLKDKVVVAGAGIAGLAAAHVLVSQGYDVTVIERSGTVGGKTSSYIDEGIGHTVEHGIHGIFPTYVNLRALWRDAGIGDGIYTDTRTAGMVGPQGMTAFSLDRVRGMAPFFLLKLIPPGVLRWVDYASALPFLMRAFAAHARPAAELDFSTFRGLLESWGVSERMKRFLLFPYVRNLSYARGEEVSAHAAVDALTFYVLERDDDVKARWLNGGPQELVFNPWFRELAKRGVRFVTRTPAQAMIRGETGAFKAFATSLVLKEKDFGAVDRVWVEKIGHHTVGLKWQANPPLLSAVNALCTHEGCPLKPKGENGLGGYRCDCHGGEFDCDGRVTKAPPQKPLPAIPVDRVGSGADAVWRLDVETAAAGEDALVEGDYGIVAVDVAAAKDLLDDGWLRHPSLAQVPLLHTSSVMVMRLWFRGAAWDGPDSGVFRDTDFLDNFFVLNAFQDEFRALTDRLVVECHVSDSERVAALDDAALMAKACECLARYFPGRLSADHLIADHSRVLRHDHVFTLFAPGDHEKSPNVTARDRPNLFFAGDWVRSPTRSWFMERAAVTGIQAANAVIQAEGGDTWPVLAKAQPALTLRLMAAPYRLLSRVSAQVRRFWGLDR